MNELRVLVFPCGTEIGLEIHSSLKFSNHIELYGANSIPDHARFVYKNYIEGVPFVDKPGFVGAIVKIVKDKKIDLIFPTHDSVVLKLARVKDKLGCRLITSPLKTCEIARSKKKTYEFFVKILRTPKVYQPTDRNITFPVFLKPEVGQGTRGTFKANTKEDVEFYLKKDPTLMILEYLPGKEYTVDCFTDRHKELRFIGPRERTRIVNGISVNSFPIKNPKIEEITKLINDLLEFRGVWFFQVKEAKNGELTLMEIAPRVGGTMGLTRNLGVNLPLLSVFDALDYDIEIIKNKHYVEVERALFSRFKTNLKFDHVYIDLDDTIFFKGKINPWIIAFLYQCLNNNKKLHLLTRHPDTYREKTIKALKKLRIVEIFDEIIDVPKGKEKYEHIKDKNSIFIDDSFSERKKASDALGIPAFDTHEIESLVDWKY